MESEIFRSHKQHRSSVTSSERNCLLPPLGLSERGSSLAQLDDSGFRSFFPRLLVSFIRLTMASLNTELFRAPSLSVTSAPSPSLLLSLVLGLALALLTWCWPRKAGNLPPGPKPGFFVGNREQVPKEGKPWRWFRDLNLQYGECEERVGRGCKLTHLRGSRTSRLPPDGTNSYHRTRLCSGESILLLHNEHGSCLLKLCGARLFAGGLGSLGET